MGSLKISCALWSISVGKTLEDFDQACAKAASAGVKAVQPWCVDEPKWQMVCALDPDRLTGAARAEVPKLAEKHGLAISGFCAQLAGPKTLGGFGEVPNLAARLTKTSKALQFAGEVGSPVVTTHIGPIPENRDDPVYKRFVDSVQKVMADSGEGVFALETGQETAEVLKRFIEDVDHPRLKVNYDPANMLKHGVVEGVPILKDYIVHTHAKDKHPETGKPTVGEGAVPWDAYIAALKAIGYDGWYAVEDESHSPDVLESIRKGCEFLKKY